MRGREETGRISVPPVSCDDEGQVLELRRRPRESAHGDRETLLRIEAADPEQDPPAREAGAGGRGSENSGTSTPFGTMSSGPPKARSANPEAARDTAIAPAIRRRTVRSAGVATASKRDLSRWAWNVATTGLSAARTASIEVLGEKGSWACTTSGRNPRTAARIRRHERREKHIGATVPLYGIRSGRPTVRTQGSAGASVPGVSTMTA